jgi:hypothetical protein
LMFPSDILILSLLCLEFSQVIIIVMRHLPAHSSDVLVID